LASDDGAPPFAIRYSPAAAKAFRKIHPTDGRRLKAAIEQLAIDPRPTGCKRLTGGDGEHRIRVGDYRVVYDVDDGTVVVLVLAIGHRREIYR
jgi:mRNA interferase RelE/StbE